MTACRLLATTAACFVAGCADFRACCDEQLVASRNNYMARTAWDERGGALCENRKHHKHFRKGFCEGYNSVACGTGGVAPLVPPDEYWTAGYQDAEGREIVNEWFAGFNEGAFAASQDGVGMLCEVPTWAGGACCDENGRIYAKVDPANRKPRRGDPPKRAHLPPSQPKIPHPKNTEGKELPPIDDPLMETPQPLKNEPEKLPPDTDIPELREKKESPPEKEPVKEKKGMVRKRSERKSPPTAKSKLEPYAIPVAAERKVTQEMGKPMVRENTPLKMQRPVVKTEGGDVRMHSPGDLPTVPLNPFYKMKLNDGPNYPVAPPVLESAAMKPGSSIALPLAPPAREPVPLMKQPPPTEMSGNDLPPPPRAKSTPMVADKPKSEPAPRPVIAPASHQEEAKPAENWQRQASTPASEAKPIDVKPQSEVAPPPSSDATKLPRDVEDGWGTPHDYPSPRKAAGK